MFLTPDDLKRLTGSSRRTRQIRWLREHDWMFETDFRGRPIVAAAEMERRLVGAQDERVESAIRWDQVA